MKKHIISILVFLLLAHYSKSQTKQKGYYLKPSGDTVFSTISFKKGNLSPTSIIAETDAGDIVLTVKDISGFGLPGAVHYRKRNVTIHTGPIEYKLAPAEFSNNVITKEVFVQVIESGTVSLYELIEKERNYFLIEEGDGAAVELLYRVKLNQNSLEEDNVYKAQLRDFAEKYNVIEDAGKLLQRISYNEKDLLSIVKLINRKTGIVTYRIKKEKVSVGLVAGLNYVLWPSSFEGAFFTPSFNFQAPGQMKLTAGINFQYVFPASKGRVQLHASALYTSAEFNQTRGDSVSDGQTSTTRLELYKLEQKTILISLAPAYVLNPKANIKLFVKPGVTLGFTLNNSNLLGAAIRKNYDQGNPTPTSFVVQNAIVDDKPYNLHMNIGAGVMVAKSKLELNFLPPVNLVNGDFFPAIKKGHVFLTYSFRIIN